MTTTQTIRSSASASQPRPRWWSPRRLRIAVAGIGALYLFSSGVNLGLTIARPSVYATFADQALFDWVTTVWHATFGTHGLLFGPLLAAGELALSLASLSKGFWSRLGLLGVIAFHLGLMLFGWWAWVWAVPVADPCHLPYGGGVELPSVRESWTDQ